jgi:hypothetical protein
MPNLTRRRYPDRPDCWHVYFGDVQVGTITRRTGNPGHSHQWEWRCGFIQGVIPASIRAERPRPSMPRAQRLKAHGRPSYRGAGDLISGHGATSAMGQPGNMPFGTQTSGFRRTNGSAASRVASS